MHEDELRRQRCLADVKDNTREGGGVESENEYILVVSLLKRNASYVRNKCRR